MAAIVAGRLSARLAGVCTDALREILGSPPVPRGTWRREAVYVSTAALAVPGAPAREVAEGLAARLRSLREVRAVRVRPNGFLEIEVSSPGEIVRDLLAEPGAEPVPGSGPGRSEGVWPDFPRTWSNPGFVVRYAYVRAGAVRRWAGELIASGAFPPEPASSFTIPSDPAASGGFRSDLLDDPADRAALRVLAELPSRRVSRDPGWPVYLERLAAAYHDAFEHAPPLPKGDEPPSAVHAARLWMARAVRKVLAEGLTELEEPLPDKI